MGDEKHRLVSPRLSFLARRKACVSSLILNILHHHPQTHEFSFRDDDKIVSLGDDAKENRESKKTDSFHVYPDQNFFHK